LLAQGCVVDQTCTPQIISQLRALFPNDTGGLNAPLDDFDALFAGHGFFVDRIANGCWDDLLHLPEDEREEVGRAADGRIVDGLTPFLARHIQPPLSGSDLLYSAV
jgi:hypothetical protein